MTQCILLPSPRLVNAKASAAELFASPYWSDACSSQRGPKYRDVLQLVGNAEAIAAFERALRAIMQVPTSCAAAGFDQPPDRP